MSITVLRVIPDQSLAEDALQDAVERLEEVIGHMMQLPSPPVAESTQVELSIDLKYLTAVVIYENHEVTSELVRVREFGPVDVQDEDINHQMVTKSVRLDVVIHGDEDASPIAVRRCEALRGAGARPVPTTIIIQRSWGACVLREPHKAALLTAFAELMLTCFRAAAGDDSIQLSKSAAEEMGPKPRAGGRPWRGRAPRRW